MNCNINFQEIFARNVLEKFYFNNCKLLVGDNFNKKLPDIYAEDYSFGIEVCQAEFREDFLQRAYIKTLIKNSKTKIKFNSKYTELKQNIKFISKINGKQKHQTISNMFYFVPINKVVNNDYDTDIFLSLYKDKASKLLQGNYKGCTETYLSIVSYYRLRELALVENFLQEISNLNSVIFSKIFLILSTSLFVIDNNKAITVIDYTDKEFENILYTSFKEYKKLTKKKNNKNKK